MRGSIFTFALISATPISATLCLLGLPDPLGLCPDTTTPKATAVVAATSTSEKPLPAQPTAVNTPANVPPPPAQETTAPIVVQTTEPTRPAATPTDWTPTSAPTVFLSAVAGSTKEPSTTLTVPVPTWDSTTTLLSVLVQTSATFVPSSGSAAAAIAGTTSQAGISGSTASSRPAQATTNAAVVKGVDRVVVLGGLGLVGWLVQELYC